MKAAWLLLLSSVVPSALAQQKTRLGQSEFPADGRLASACGSASASFKVSLDRKWHSPLPPQSGQAMLYFIHDAGIPFENVTFGYPTTKYALDGSWVGAGHGDSWFAVPVAPGDHHICSTLQSSFVENRVELAHFTAEPGGAYYFRTRLVMSQSVELLELDRIDSDQGQYLVSAFPMSSSTPKK